MYIREAHPDSVLYSFIDGQETLEKIAQTETLESRSQTALVCSVTLKLTIPAVVDLEDNAVNAAYAGWPDRLYVVAMDGSIGYVGEPGPGGFKPAEVEQWLRENLSTQSD